MSNYTETEIKQVAATTPFLVSPLGAITLATNPYIYLLDSSGNLLGCCCATNGQLAPNWFSFGVPDGSPLQTAGAIATDSQATVYAFAMDGNGTVWCNTNNGTAPVPGGSENWTNLGAPTNSNGQISLQFIGAALFNGSPLVVCQGNDGNVWVTSTSSSPNTWATPGPIGNGTTPQMAIGVTLSSTTLQMSVIGSDGCLHVCDMATDGSFSWEPVAPQTTMATPVGATSLQGCLYAFGLDASGNLQCVYWNAGWQTADLGQPLTGPCASAIGANISAAGLPTAYVTDGPGAMWCNSPTSPNWTSLGMPDGSPIEAGIGVTTNASSDFVFILSSSDEAWGFSSGNTPPWVPMD